MTAAEKHVAAGLSRLGDGSYGAALASFERAAQLAPDDPRIDFYLGETHRLRREPERALDCFRRAEARKLRHPELSLRLGLVHSALGQIPEAAASYRSALVHDPESVTVLCNLANAEAKLGDIDRAIGLYERAVGLQPEFEEARKNLGLMLFSAKRWLEASEHLQPAADHLPLDLNVAEKLAFALAEAGRTDDAVSHYQSILRRDPGQPIATTNLANLHYHCGRMEEALGLYESLAERFPTSAVYQLHLGTALYSLDRFEDAFEAFDRARSLCDDCEMARRVGREIVLGRIDLYRGMSELLRGNLGPGWDGYENRWAAKEPLPQALINAPGKIWNGEDITDRRLFILREQGIGDEIMFASMFNEVIARAGECVIQCNERLADTFARSFPAAQIRPAPESHEAWIALAEEMRGDDYRVFAGSLPRLLRREFSDFPAHSGYLRPDPERSNYWRDRLDALGPGLKVGISWAGGTLKNGARLRSLTLADLRELVEIPGVIPVSLQYTECIDEIRAFRDETGNRIHHWPEAIDDYGATIDLVSELDVVISVQTAIVHAAGALNKRTWVLLPLARTSWRWFGHREICAWYPSVRFFHQHERGNWRSALTHATNALRNLADET